MTAPTAERQPSLAVTFDHIGPISLPLEIDDLVLRFNLTYFETTDGRWAAASLGDIVSAEPVLTRIESACLFGHVFGSRQCDCGFQLHEAFRQIAARGRGLVIYGIDQDARGLGIRRHFEIYRYRQRDGLDTDEIYRRFDAPKDNRDYAVVGAILRHLGVEAVQLMSNNPARLQGIRDLGFAVERLPLEAELDDFNMATLMLEKEDLGYQWTFQTHGYWLAQIQSEVGENIDRRAALIVADNQHVVARWAGDDWNVAAALTASGAPAGSSRLIVYLSDLPRRDELAHYSEIGARFVVVPFALVPAPLIETAAQLGIKLQDWGRENHYSYDRPQWEFVKSDEVRDLYVRAGEHREFRR